MRKLRLALLCGVLAALPVLAQQPQAEPEVNPLEAVRDAVRGFFNRMFGGDAAKPEDAAPGETPKPAAEQPSQRPAPAEAPPAAAAKAPIARTVDRGLHDAIASGDHESALKMLDRGADIEAREPGAGASVLHFAVMKGSMPIVELLLKRGADINSRTRNGTTPLHTAVLYERLEVAEFLIGKGAELNAQSVSGATPLALAVAANNQRVAARLRALGAR